MIPTILRLISLIASALKLRSNFALENLAFRQQLAILKRQQGAPEASVIRSQLEKDAPDREALYRSRMAS